MAARDRRPARRDRLVHADAYERGRPDYPAEASTRVMLELDPATDSTVLDLGAGSGRLTRTLVEPIPRVVAIDLSEAMLARLRAELPLVAAGGSDPAR